MLSIEPYRGVRDFYPADLKLRNYIFNTWRKVCESFGFEEYDGPLLEPFELYAAKTGEEVVNEQLYYFEDKGGRKVAIRPEMTPTVSRMVANQISKQSPTPIKWFSIANFYRYEKPQKGRGREFYQLNADIFGESSVNADLEILLLNKKIMETLGAKDNMYELRINNRFLLNFLFTSKVGMSQDQVKPVSRIVDRMAKISEEDFKEQLLGAGLSESQVKILNEVLKYKLDDLKYIPELPANAKDLITLFTLLNQNGVRNARYCPDTVRGLDYYDGNVFEQFDLTPGNNRSMFGGGRYNGLISLFIDKEVPAVGFAPGDMTTIEFLKSWNLVPKFENTSKVLVTVFPQNPDCQKKSGQVAQALREFINSELFLNPETELSKQIKYADRKGIPFVLIIGPEELKKGTVLVKELGSGSQFECKNIDEIVSKITL